MEELRKEQTKNQVLSAENKRLRAKLNKAKTQTESLTQKHNSVHESLKAVEDKLAAQIEANISMRNEIDEIRRNQAKLDKSEVTEILARVKVSGVGFTLLQDTIGRSTWHQDQQIVKIQEQLSQ